MKKLLFSLFGVIVFLMTVVTVVSAYDDQKVTICHHNNGNDYTIDTSDQKGDVNGHNNHSDDIIPPFDYNCDNQNNTCHYNGKNWDTTHQAIWQNGCKIDSVTVTVTPTPTPTISPTSTLDCDGDFDGNHPNSDDNCGVTPTVTPTPEEDNDCLLPGQPDLDNSTDDHICVTPTEIPSSTPTPTPDTVNSNNNTNSNNSSSSSNNSTGSSNNNNTQPQQTVLAASTMADTGNFQDTTMNLTLLGGMLSLGLGLFSYGKEKNA